MVQVLCKAVWQFLKEFNAELPYDPSIPLPGMYTKKPKTGTQKVYIYTCSYQLYSQHPEVKTSQMSINQ